MIRRLLVGLVLAIAAITPVGGTALARPDAAALVPDRAFSVTYTCMSGCTGSFMHLYIVHATCSGHFSGFGTLTGHPGYTERISGRVHHSRLRFHSVYTGQNAGYTIRAAGMVAKDGTVSGMARAPGQLLRFVSSAGAAKSLAGCVAKR